MFATSARSARRVSREGKLLRPVSMSMVLGWSSPGRLQRRCARKVLLQREIR